MSQDKEDELQQQIDEVSAEQAEDAQVEEPENEDDAEWLAAKAAVEAEESGEGGDPEPEPEPEGEDGEARAAEPEPEPEAPPQEDDQPKAVPKPRFDEVNAARREALERAAAAERRAAYWEGLAQGRTPLKPEPEPEPDPVAALVAEHEGLGKRYDEGEISAGDYNRENLRLTKEILKAEAARDAKPEPKEPEFDEAKFQQELLDDLSVQRAFQEIADANEWLNQPTRGRQHGLREDLADLNDRAFELAKAEGVKINPRTKQGVVLHRAFLMAAAHEAGLPEKYGWKPPEKQPEPQPEEQKRPAQPPGSPTPEQRKQKAQLRNQHPGDPTQAGTAGAPGYEPSTQEILDMDDEEIDALPESVKQKLRGDR